MTRSSGRGCSSQPSSPREERDGERAISRPPAEPVASRVERAAEELHALILDHHPDATFAARRGEEPDGLYMDVYAAPADVERIWALCEPRVLELAKAELPLHLVPLDTAGR